MTCMTWYLLSTLIHHNITTTTWITAETKAQNVPQNQCWHYLSRRGSISQFVSIIDNHFQVVPTSSATSIICFPSIHIAENVHNRREMGRSRWINKLRMSKASENFIFHETCKAWINSSSSACKAVIIEDVVWTIWSTRYFIWNSLCLHWSYVLPNIGNHLLV